MAMLDMTRHNWCLYCGQHAGLVNRITCDMNVAELIAAYPNTVLDERAQEKLARFEEATQGNGSVLGWMCAKCVAEGEALADECRPDSDTDS